MNGSPLFCRRCGSVRTKSMYGQWGPHTHKIVCAEGCGFITWGTPNNGPSWKERALFYIRKMAKCGDVDAMELVDRDGKPT